MARSPQISIGPPHNDPQGPTTIRNAANGQKLPWFKAVARKAADRNYVPRTTP